MEQRELTTATKPATSSDAATSGVATASAASVASATPKVITQEEKVVIESLIEANVQRSLDSLDSWKLTAPFRGEKGATDPNRCSKEKHTCNMEADDIGTLCVGCILYRRIVIERSMFPVGGRADVCDYLASGIAEPLIFAFIRDGGWLAPAQKLEGKWFVKHPITFAMRPQTSIIPASQASIRRNKVRLYQADTLLERLGIATSKENILARLHDYWHTETGGVIYSLDELLDLLGPIATIAAGANKMGLSLANIDLGRVAAGTQGILAETSR
jgi:hypothetical protein